MNPVLLDSTLRDGAQAEGISFSVDDKIKIALALDELGIGVIEAGNPGSNPKDLEFFSRARSLGLKNSKLAAFGSTRRKNVDCSEDKSLKSILDAGVPIAVFFGKTWSFHATEILQASLEENLAMIKDTAAYFSSFGKEVIFDAEHFFDGCKADKPYAMACLKAALEGGAKTLVLCDTNGGALPHEVQAIVKEVVDLFDATIGIHCHNDCGMAEANTVMAALAGCSHFQGTFTGFGERCGNASIASVIANLQLKLGIECVSPEKLGLLTQTARVISDLANIKLSERQPYVGRSAFAHKGGMHIDAVVKEPMSYEHTDPELVGNTRKLLTSEVAGKSAILSKIKRICPHLSKESPETEAVLNRIKELEHQGYQFEAAEGTIELVIRKQLGKYKPLFTLEKFRITGEKPYSLGSSAYAMMKITVDGKTEMSAAEGVGPVHALDLALRKALEVFYPQISKLRLTDYKVRVMDSKTATASKVRVLIETTDGIESWATVGVSEDIIEASWTALVDSMEYKLIKDIENRFKAYL
ncbi:MAG: citramalate synthase [Clostridiales bacterium]|jgi:2-isopropylmalate synthase|nr:citramalate synthase [Clostridiales bacterium]